MADLILKPNLAQADDVYADLLAAHEGLSKEDSDALNARLILMDLTGVDEKLFFTGDPGPDLSPKSEQVLWDKVKRRAAASISSMLAMS